MSSRQPKKKKAKGSLVKSRPRAPPAGKRKRESAFPELDEGADIFHDAGQAEKQAAADSEPEEEAQETAEEKRLRLGMCRSARVPVLCHASRMHPASRYDTLHKRAASFEVRISREEMKLADATQSMRPSYCILVKQSADVVALQGVSTSRAACLALQPKRTCSGSASWTPRSGAATMRRTMKEEGESAMRGCRSGCDKKLWRSDCQPPRQSSTTVASFTIGRWESPAE